MLLTLTRYILRDLFKLIGMASAVLVLLLAVGAAIKPISEGLLGPWQMIKVISYLVPGVLPYALPFAASFAATLVFFRLAADNEITACAASGISYRALIMPVVTVGLAMMLVMFILSNWVVPTFWARVERLLEQDITRLVIEQVKRRETISFRPPGSSREFLIYADRAEARDMAEQPDGPYRRIILQGVAVGMVDAGTGRLLADFTGELAVADFYRHRDRHYIALALTNATLKDPKSGVLTAFRRQGLRPIEIPSPIQQNPKLLSLTRLRQIAREPDLHAEVRHDKLQLAETLAQQQAIRQAVRALTNPTGSRRLELAGPNGRLYRIESPRVVPDDDSIDLAASETDPVLVRVWRGEAFDQRFEARFAELRVDINEMTGQPRLNLTMEQVTVIDPDLPTPSSQVGSIYRPGLQLGGEVEQAALGLGAIELLEKAEDDPPPAVQRAAQQLARRINDLRRDIGIQLNVRAAMSIASLLVMLLGAVMAMTLRHSSPLVIFFFCFLPTVLAIIMINGAQNFVKANPFGMPLQVNLLSIWVGDLMLGGLVLGVYHRLNRN
jgi:lipopolysaccharide export system permease protein